MKNYELPHIVSWKHLNINRLGFLLLFIIGIHNLHLMLSSSGIFSGIRAPYFTVVCLTLIFCIHDIQSLDLSKSALLDWVSFFVKLSPLENSEMAPSDRQPPFSPFLCFASRCACI